MDEDGVAPGKDHVQDVGELVLRSVKLTHPASHITVGVPEKAATGGLQFVTVVVTGFDVAELGDAQAAFDVMLTVTTSPLVRLEVVNEEVPLPAFVPLIIH